MFPYRILVADDDDELRQSLAELLSRLGFSVLEAADGPSALRLARRGEVSVSILDVHMPGMSGLEVLQVMQHERGDIFGLFARVAKRFGFPVRTLPCILMSAEATANEQRELLCQGAFRFLRKPLCVDELRNSVSELMRAILAGSGTGLVGPLAKGSALPVPFGFHLPRHPRVRPGSPESSPESEGDRDRC